MKDLLRMVSLVQLVWDALVAFAKSPEGLQRIDAVIGDLLDDGELNGSNQTEGQAGSVGPNDEGVAGESVAPRSKIVRGAKRQDSGQ